MCRIQNPTCMGKFSDTMRWLARDVRCEPGKKDVIVNASTFITGMCHVDVIASF